MLDTASEQYNELLETDFDEYYSLTHAKRMNPKYKLKTLFI